MNRRRFPIDEPRIRKIEHPLVDVLLVTARNESGGRCVTAVELFGDDSSYAHSFPFDTFSESAVWAAQIEAFLNKNPYWFSHIPLDFHQVTHFQRKVYQAVRTIGHGVTITYAELARRAGRPGAARAVGGAMRANPFPLLIPCHRVVRGDGSTGGYGGALSGNRPDLKRRLIEHERLFAAGER